MKLSTYNSLLTGKRTVLVATIGKTGKPDYREIQVIREMNKFHFRITDGYTFLVVKGGFTQGLKSVLNIAEGYALQSIKGV
jgi:hypothetical protein